MKKKNRGNGFHGLRETLISSQHDVDFDKSHYEKIRKVYSIWLCMDPPGDESGITQYRVQENLKYGMIGEEEKHYDLAQAVMVYISSKKRDPGNRLLRLLYELFKSDDNAAGKMKTLENDYQIKLNESEEGMVDIMCNLSVGIAKAGVDKGYLLGRQDGRIEGRKAYEMVCGLGKRKISAKSRCACWKIICRWKSS